MASRPVGISGKSGEVDAMPITRRSASEAEERESDTATDCPARLVSSFSHAVPAGRMRTSETIAGRLSAAADGRSSSRGLPSASAVPYPNVRAAPAFQLAISPSDVKLKIARSPGKVP
jgi:hypothetical protein